MNFILITIFAVLHLNFCSAEYGFVVASSPGIEDLRLCSKYNPSFVELKDNLSEAKSYEVIDNYPSEACEPFTTENFQNNLVIVKRKNCTFAAKAINVQDSQGSGVIIVSEDEITIPSANKSMYEKVKIPVSMISNQSYNELSEFIKMNTQVRIKQYAPPLPTRWDPDSIIMLVLAVSTCAIGAWLQRASHVACVERSKKHDGINVDEEESSDDIDITIFQAFIFFGMCSVSILLMYFFYDYLVYVIIGIFCYASSMAVFDLIYPAFKQSSCFTKKKLPPNTIPCLKTQPPIMAVILYLVCVAFAVVWAVFRKASFAWILQDILGFAFCVFMIKQLKLKSFKLTSTILILFFLYDIFYVFVTPLFTKDRQSIMEKVATGGTHGSHEQLPMLFKLPKFFSSVYDTCAASSYSMLGYGDVILPGVHVGFCAVWDVAISNSVVKKHVYYPAAVIGYTVGLVLTFVALYLMNTGQPALLYLTPCCLFSTLIVAIKRSELKAIWKGIDSKKPKTSAITTDNHDAEEQSLLTT